MTEHNLFNTGSLKLWIAWWSGLLGAALLFGGLASPAGATPLYAARAGRTCDNCHTDPSGWQNPELASRKCNLSCMGCHVDPSGGGLRTVAGRFYAEATLPMGLASHRGYKDQGRFPFGLELDGERRNRTPELAWWTPLGGSSGTAFDQGRYAGLNADPLLQVGLDARLATWLSGESVTVFPMQLDTHAALRPVKHVTLFTTAGVIAESRGFGATAERETAFAVKDAWGMVHQLPYMSYARVGRFVPAFGTRTEDHTSFIRRDFELDLGSRLSRVTGVEVGLAPNYPIVQASVFRPNSSDRLQSGDPLNQRDPPVLGVDGWGGALHAGWRDLVWQVGASGMLRRRALEDGGDTTEGSLQGGLNLAAVSDSVPVTLLGEVALGRRQRPRSGRGSTHTAAMAELGWLVINGLNLRLKFDYSDADTEVEADHVYRLGLGFDLNPIPNLTLTAQARFGVAPTAGGEEDEGEAEGGGDAIIFLHGWF